MPIIRIRAIHARHESASETRFPYAVAGRTTIALTALITVLALALTLGTPTSASAISRDQVLARGQVRVDAPVPYSQSRYYAGYRTDCSGYVSMAWSTKTSWSTRSFHLVSHRITTSQLKPGDALLKKGYHIRMFYGWVDAKHTQYVAYETSNGSYAGTRIHSIAEDLAYGYVPTRYNRITDSPKPLSVLQNGSFDVWSRSWSGAEQPVWWQSNESWRQTLVTHRKDTYRATRSSLRLTNPSDDPEEYTELSQSAPVVAGATYYLSSWAKTDSAPAGVELKLAYLNAAGEALVETSTSGDRARLNGSSFKRMAMLTAAPAGTVKALVTVRLAPSTTVDASGTIIPGTSVTLDEIVMTRPKVTVAIKTSSTAGRNNKRIVLSGAVTPAAAVGAPAVIYVQRPGTGWTKLATTRVYASGSAGAWKGSYTFNKRMRRGTYRFMTNVSGVPGYLGKTTGAVNVRLR